MLYVQYGGLSGQYHTTLQKYYFTPEDTKAQLNKMWNSRLFPDWLLW